jgi:hypothetical protein
MSYNFAAYVRPQWVPGLEFGGNYYRGVLLPPGLSKINQSIGSVYAVYNSSRWEFLNEGFC